MATPLFWFHRLMNQNSKHEEMMATLQRRRDRAAETSQQHA